MTTEIDLSLEKCKIGPLYARYQNGEYIDVRSGPDDPQRYAVLGLDNSHNRDYKVGYASSPLLVFSAPRGNTHRELESALESLGVWDSRLRAIEIPVSGGYRNGYASLPERATWFDHYANAIENSAVGGFRRTPTAVSGFVAVE